MKFSTIIICPTCSQNYVVAIFEDKEVDPTSCPFCGGDVDPEEDSPSLFSWLNFDEHKGVIRDAYRYEDKVRGEFRKEQDES